LNYRSRLLSETYKHFTRSRIDARCPPERARATCCPEVRWRTSNYGRQMNPERWRRIEEI
jgi:hypothetical protein